jgi:hypothetical protein
LYQKIRTRGNPEIAQTVVAMVSDEIRAVLNYLAKADYIPKHGKSAHMENDDEAAA